MIARIRSRLPAAVPGLIVGPGDDAAVMERPKGLELALTTDAIVEGIHFDRAFTPLDAVGHRALAVNLSDLAAMGASPLACLLSLALPDATDVADLDRFLDGFLAIAAAHGVAVAGGNISRSPSVLFIDVTAIGAVHRRRILTRAGARRGDDVWLSGEIGGAAAGLERLRAQGRGTRDTGHGAGDAGLGARDEGSEDACVERFLRPQPRLRLGRALASHRAASACIDLSDGLGDAVRQLAGASGVGMVIEADALPIAPAARAWFELRGASPIDRAVAGGDDYELLFTSAPKMRRRLAAVSRAGRVPIARIGRVTTDRRILLRRAGREHELPAGFAHFR